MADSNELISKLDKAATTTPESIVAGTLHDLKGASGAFVIRSAEGVVLFPADEPVAGADFLDLEG
jgi:hypothetical protein